MLSRQKWHIILEHYVPERRLFLRTETETRFVRLSPATQIFAIIGCVCIIGWSIIATALILMDNIGAGNFRDQAIRDQVLYEERLNALADERDTRTEEALAAQARFNTALDQISIMQSQLLASEDRRKELERGIEVIQSTLRRTIIERDDRTRELTTIQGELITDGSAVPDAARAQEAETTLSYLTDALEMTAAERDQATQTADDANEKLAELDLDMQILEERTDEIFRQLEDAMTISVKPLDNMFRSAGLSTSRLLDAVKRGYSGQGGALSPISAPTRSGAPSQDEIRANRILKQLDTLNMYRIAASKAPFAIPVKGNYRRTSGFGPRWGRMHNGTDFAAPHGSPIYATANGVVSKAGWGSGYGRVIYIKHDFGIETRYAHLSRIRVKVGQRVSRGQRIGDMGNTGRSTGTHLHYEVRVNGKAVNPMIYIKAANNVF
ncbi:MAG: M23 family metallopeptidase [Pseudomonadota bacterium]